MSFMYKLWLRRHYPATIVCDRYDGTYSGGRWLAFPLDYYEIPVGVDGDDTECAMFWHSYDEPVGRGDSPEEALGDLAYRILRIVEQTADHLTEA